MMSFFDQRQIFFTVLGYDMSYLEFFGTIAGAIAVWLSARGNVWSWPIGVINVVLFFFLFYQQTLYPDMVLMVFFCITNLIGWWRWLNPRKGEEDRQQELRVTFAPSRQLVLLAGIGIAGTLVSGALAGHVHEWFPRYFPKPSAYPYVDSFIMVFSIITTFWMIQKRVECWALWFVIDVVGTGLYFVKGIKFVGVEYFVFCFIAAFGYWHWYKEARSYSTEAR